jgi:hypothetical protein
MRSLCFGIVVCNVSRHSASAATCIESGMRYVSSSIAFEVYNTINTANMVSGNEANIELLEFHSITKTVRLNVTTAHCIKHWLCETYKKY